MDSTEGMKTLRLHYNNNLFDIEVDHETYRDLIYENLRNQYAKTLFQSNLTLNSSLDHASSCLTSRGPESTMLIPSYCENTASEESQSLLSPGLSLRCLPGTSSYKESEPFKWDNNSIKLLLNIRLNMEFCVPSCKKKKLWEKVASELNVVLEGQRVTGDICDSKYRNLLRTYRVNKRKQNTTGEGAIKWDFFEIMDQALGHKAPSVPPKKLLGSTTEIEHRNISLPNQNNETSDEERTCIESDESPTSIPLQGKKKKKEELSFKRYLFLKHTRDKEKQSECKEKDEQRWQEKRAKTKRNRGN